MHKETDARGYAEHSATFAKVGVGYNGSRESETALAMARALAAQSGASVHALDVISLPTYAYTGLMSPAIGDSIEVMLQQADASLKQLPEVQGRAVYGVTGEELAAFGDELDLLIVGSRGYGPVRRLVLGSTSDYLERHARCSLLVLARGAGTGHDKDADGRELQAADHL